MSIFQIVVTVVIILLMNNKIFPYGITWSSRNSDHPGWWLTKSETVYIRKLQKKPSGENKDVGP